MADSPMAGPWYHSSNEERLNPRRKQAGNVGGGLHVGSLAAGRHERYETMGEYDTVAGNRVYPRMGRPFTHVYGLLGKQFGRTSDMGVSWPRKSPDVPMLYQNTVEDKGSMSAWAAPEQLSYRGTIRNDEVHVTDLHESQVRATADGRITEQLKLPGIGAALGTWWER